ncbi:cupin domain-containing protein [Flavobacterium jejuense]|uniref:Cupin domain-containing protein n=1 Tax=Flavobacterium jejuense TaxID=1544455 RepID=A0ABX0ISM0_9FLAO|nr:cupin domain-containing protein [Flavobacterium jejuense]NHN25804.1 cupin domain-containing protein [Flavobacterium jejuense]
MFIESKDYKWEKIDKNLDRAIIGYDNALMQTIVKFKKGGIGYLHQHIHSQVAFIVKGSFEVQIEEEKKILHSGDTFFIPSNKMHGVVCLEEGILVESFSPMREDFLK